MAEYRDPDALVSTGWLEAHLDEPGLRIYDCTTDLRPAEPHEPVPYYPEPARAGYDEGHIPRAGFLDLHGELSDNSSPFYFMLPSEEQLAVALGRHGIGEGMRAVLYSGGSMMWATRVWWMLRAMGFDRAAVLDGGLDKWRAEGRPLTTEPCRYPQARFVARPRPGLFEDKDAVLAAIADRNTCLIHTLSREAFRGDGESRYGRPGRIPRSVNLPWADLVDPDSHAFVAADDALKMFQGVGADRAERVITYCGGGISATMSLFLLHQLGYANLALYDASMGEWAVDETLPIERG